MKQHGTSFVTFPSVALFLLSVQLMAHAAEIPELSPGDPAPPFVLQSTRGLLKFDIMNSSFGLQPPIVFHAFSNNSGFLEWLVDNPDSIESLIHLSPNNTHYVFMFYDTPKKHAKSLKRKFRQALESYFSKTYLESSGFGTPSNSPTPGHSYHSESSRFGRPNDRSTPGHGNGNIPTKRPGTTYRNPLRPSLPVTTMTLKKFMNQWTERLHFITFPVSQLGNWIPRVLSQWYCSGHGCGLDQLVLESGTGEISKVSKRLDARYDWLPSIESLARFGHLNIVYAGDACSPNISSNVSGNLALVSMAGNCSSFEKVLNSQKNGALGVVVFSEPNKTLQDMNCVGKECDTQLSIPATMIPYETGVRFTDNSAGLFARFQTSPSDTFFFGIDGQGKLQETGWFLFPSMRFMAYQAQWFNYKTEMLHNLTETAKKINIFDATDISGKGANATVEIPSLKELQQYEHIELDMSLSCPGNRDDTCPHWDHVVQVLVCCGKELCGQELGRWITAFRRRIGRWLTPIKPLIPLLSSGGSGSSKCMFKVSTASWAMPWIVTLNIRLAGKIQENAARLRNTLVPFMIEPLFRGGRFDENYNTKYQPITFTLPPNCKRVELVAVITGHGSDNNNCAEFCITSHHFVVNSRYNNTRKFKNAGNAMGCAERVREGVVPNEHGTWLYGRDGWCDGQDVVPWVQDISLQVHKDQNNTIEYYGWFNGTDPNPTANAGEIIMYSYLVYYQPKGQDSSTVLS